MLLGMQVRKQLKLLIQTCKTLPRMQQRKKKNMKEGLLDMEDRMRQSHKCLIGVSEGKK